MNCCTCCCKSILVCLITIIVIIILVVIILAIIYGPAIYEGYIAVKTAEEVYVNVSSDHPDYVKAAKELLPLVLNWINLNDIFWLYKWYFKII